MMNQNGKRIIKSTSATLLGLVLIIPSLYEVQEHTPITFTTKADVASSYVWRGMYESGLSVQPTLSTTVNNFSLTT